MLNPRSRRRGQTLVEAIVALGVISISLIAIIGFLNKSAGSVPIVIDRSIGSALAKEGIGIVRTAVELEKTSGRFVQNFSGGRFEIDYENGLGDIPKNDWQRVVGPRSGTPLLFDGRLYSYQNGTPTKFFRTVDIDIGAGPTQFLRVNSIVQWQRKGGGSEEINLETYFYDY